LDAEHLRKSGYAEMQRLIREEEAPKPSARLSTQQGEALAQIAKHRSTEPSQLNRQVQGDLDWIVMKALEKDRNRRYETATGFLADVQRYLNNESVLACPPTTSYRLRKFISRNRQAVLVASSIATALLLAIVGLSVGYQQAHHSAKEARIAWINVSQEQEQTEKERDRAEQQRRLAVEKSQQLEAKNTEINRNLYAAQMAAGVQALERPDGLGRVENLTDNWLPQPDQDDLRGWEWYYLRSKLGKEWKAFSKDEGFVIWTTEGIRVLKHELDDGSLTICNGDNGDVLFTLPGGSVHADLASSGDARWWAARLSQDGQWLALESSDGTICIWELQTGRLANTLPMQGETLAQNALSSDGALIATINRARNITIWERQTGNPVAHIATDRVRMEHERWLPFVCWSPDGSRIAVTQHGSDKLYVFGASADQDLKLTVTDVPPMLSLAWRPDSQAIAIAKASGDKQIRLVDVDTGVELNSFPIEHKRFAWQLAWAPDRRRLATGSSDKTIKLWDSETGQLLATLRGHTGKIEGLNWSPDGSYLISHADDGVKIWDTNTNPQSRAPITQGGWIRSLKWSPDSNRLAWQKGGQITLWDVPQAKAITHLPAATSGLAWSPDSEGTSVAYGQHDNTVTIWHNSTREVVGSLAGHDQRVDCLSWQSEKIATGGADQAVRLWDTKTRKLLDEHHLHEAGVSTLALSRNGDFLASGGYDQWLYIWDVEQRKPAFSHRYNSIVRQVAWSPVDERLAVAAGEEEVVYIWDMQAGRNQLQLKGHTNSVGHIAWSRDGARIASAAMDRTLKIWDTQTGRELVSLDAPHVITSIDWSPDGHKIAAGFFALDEIIIWDASHGYDLERLRSKNEKSVVRE
ncbi:MAG: hypothetical protein NXI32_29960, partial [bacterium]|nr:hypothetical protein [bacterium]